MISIEQVFHNIPMTKELIIIFFLLLALILLKQSIKKTSYKKKQIKGAKYEKLVSQRYQKENYDVYEKGLKEGFKDAGIDLVARRNDEILLIQCKNWDINNKYRVREKEVREFYGACQFYIDEKGLNKHNTICIYIVPDAKLILPNAKGLFKKHYKNCRFEIIYMK